jgi:uncharacterized membrane protein YvbJ
MQCRKCGAEIAEKALICYRCGTATTEAKYQPAPLSRQRSSSRMIALVIAIAVAILFALYLWSSMR